METYYKIWWLVHTHLLKVNAVNVLFVAVNLILSLREWKHLVVFYTPTEMRLCWQIVVFHFLADRLHGLVWNAGARSTSGPCVLTRLSGPEGLLPLQVSGTSSKYFCSTSLTVPMLSQHSDINFIMTKGILVIYFENKVQEKMQNSPNISEDFLLKDICSSIKHWLYNPWET